MFGKGNRRREERPRRSFKLPAVDWRLVTALVICASSGAGLYLGAAWMLNRPFDTIVVKGAFERVSAVQIEAIVEPFAQAGFVGVDLGATRRALLALPWVAGAEVRRRWPGTLEVNVREQVPVACWGERGLLNATGELFLAAADHVPAELPRLQGPPGSEAQVTARYFALQQQLEHRGMAALGVTLDERGAWSFRTSSGLQVRLGANDVEQRIGRFFTVLDGTLGRLGREVEYVDMRYPNGFAIGWKRPGAAAVAAAEESLPNA
jgi:cell division protein FtsQ